MTTQVVTTESFAKDVLQSDLPVLVDFWAPWCGPCRQLAPVIDSVAGELSGRLLVSKVNVDDAPHLANTYGIKGIPTLILFSNGVEQRRVVGLIPKDDIINLLDDVLPKKVS